MGDVERGRGRTLRKVEERDSKRVDVAEGMALTLMDSA